MHPRWLAGSIDKSHFCFNFYTWTHFESHKRTLTLQKWGGLLMYKIANSKLTLLAIVAVVAVALIAVYMKGNPMMAVVAKDLTADA